MQNNKKALFASGLALLYGITVPLSSNAEINWESEWDTYEDKVCFYEDGHFEDLIGCLTPGASKQGGSYGNEKISSIKIYGDAYAHVFDSDKFGGSNAVITVSVDNLNKLDNDISSLRVHRNNTGGSVCFYGEEGYKGTPYCVLNGGDKNFRDGWMHNNAESMMILGDAEVKVYDGEYSTNEDNEVLNRSFGRLEDADRDGGRGWRNDITSVRVRKKGTWLGKDTGIEYATHEQERVTNQSTIFEANMMASHNTYNSDNYVDEVFGFNHKAGMTDQLELGVRHIELDINGESGTSVCHKPDCPFDGKTAKIGWLSVEEYDTKTRIERMLIELKNNIEQADDNDLYVIKIEDNIKGGTSAYRRLRQIADRVLGNYIYRPDRESSDASCAQIPQVNLADIVHKEGKRVIFWVLNCDSDMYPADLQTVLFDSGGGQPNPNKNYSSSCHGVKFSPTSLNLAIEDQRDSVKDFNSTIDLVTGEEAYYRMDNDDLRPALECGLNSLAADMWRFASSSTDERRRGNLWSWNGVNIQGDHGDCGYYDFPQKRFNDTSNCQATKPYICEQADGTLAITETTGSWEDGESVCNAEFPGSQFSLPTYAYEAKQLRNLHASSGVDASTIWIDYQRIGDDWVPERNKSFFTIQSRNSGLCIGVKEDNLIAGAKLSLEECDGADIQRWYYNHSEKRFHNKLNASLCFSHDGSNASQKRIVLENCGENPSNDHKWYLSGNSSSGIVIRNYAHNDLMLDAVNNASEVEQRSASAPNIDRLWRFVY